jgi:putative tricarboxylic transport membrane protein
MLENLTLGASVAFSIQNILYAALGCFLGTLIGVLPGIGPLSTVAILLPITFALPPETAIIMLAAIYYGSQYGGSTTAILLNLPGEASSVVTTLDGNAMARQGRAGPALAIAALASLFAGCVSTLLIAAFGPVLAKFALKFTSPEYFSLMVAGLCLAVTLSSGSLIKSLGMIIIGLILGLVGTDVNSGIHRFAFGFVELWDGLDIVALTVGLFALGEISASLENPQRRGGLVGKVTNLMPSWKDLKIAFLPAVRGTSLGSILGILPGGGALISSFAAYAVEQRIGKNPETFGKGRIEGVAAPEAANNAGAQTSFIPMLTLGIPGNALTAVLLGALMIHGVAPGPQLMNTHPEVFWGLIVSMWVGNVILVILNLPLVSLWVKLVQVPYNALFLGIVLLCCIGIYGSNFSAADVTMAAGFGLFGYLLRKLGCEPVPMVLGFVLGPMMEENFRRSLTITRGDASVFFTRPISLALLVIAALILVAAVMPQIKKSREQHLQETT